MTPDDSRSAAVETSTDDRRSGDPSAIADSFQALTVGVLAVESPEHVCTAINRAARGLLGEQVRLGASCRTTAAGWLVWLLDQAYRSGTTVSSGEMRVSEQRLIATVTPLFTAGVVHGVAVQLMDVTAEVRTREAAADWADEIGQRRLVTRGFALAVQHALLPEFLPVLPGVRLAAHYRVAAGERAGGDWFDAVPLSGGRLALAAGDVAGHGAKASATMSQLRAALATLLLDGYDVAQVCARLDRFVARMPGAGGTTLGLAILDPATGELTYGCSGHPPPLVLKPSGVARYLPADPGVPLGTLSAAPRVGRARLERGDLLLLFTDGLVERSGRSLAGGLAELQEYLEDAAFRPATDPGGLDELCRRCIEEMTEDEPDDDVSLIAVLRTEGGVGLFRRELTATVGALPTLRTELSEWLGPLGASELDLQDIQIAVGEAVANVIEHAYPDSDGAGGPVTVEVYHDQDGRVCITVADAGTWRAPPVEPAERGRGLIMIRACMDTVEIDNSGDGTALQMDRRLRRPPVLGPGDGGPGHGGPEHGGPGHGGPVHGEPGHSGPVHGGPGHGGARHRAVRARPVETAFGAVVRRLPRPELLVRGPVDTSTAAAFREYLSDASRGGSLPLHIDLTEVTHLASAGVQALFEFVEQMASDGRSLVLTAPPASPARYVLELTGLDHLVSRGP